MDAQQPRQANRVRLHASDYYFLVLMGVCAASVIMNWSDYDRCQDPMHVWLLADYATLFVFRLLALQNQYLANSRNRFCVCVNRIVMVALLFPFLWVWTVLGSIWFHRSGSCLADTTQYWGVLIWLIFMYIYLVMFSALVCFAVRSYLWVRRHRGSNGDGLQGHLNRLQAMTAYGAPIPQLGLTSRQISRLPERELTEAPADNFATCSICFEELEAGDRVRDLPCVHIFHSECIDRWLAQKRNCPNCNQDVTQPLASRVRVAASSTASISSVQLSEVVTRDAATSQSPGYSSDMTAEPNTAAASALPAYAVATPTSVGSGAGVDLESGTTALISRQERH